MYGPSDSDILLILLILWGVELLLFGVAGSMAGEWRDRPVLGLLLGLFFGPIGIGLVFLLPSAAERERRKKLVEEKKAKSKRPVMGERGLWYDLMKEK